MTTSEINAKIEEIRQRWANSQVAFDVEWLLTQLQAEQQKNADLESGIPDICMERDMAEVAYGDLQCKNKTLREALNAVQNRLRKDAFGRDPWNAEDLRKQIDAALAKDGGR